MKRPLKPVARAMRRDERVAERRFLWTVLAATIALHIISSAIAITAVTRGVPPHPRLAGEQRKK